MSASTFGVLAAVSSREKGHWRQTRSRVGILLLLNIPLIAMPLVMNLRGIQPAALVIFYVAGIILGYYVLPLLVIVSIFSIALFFAPSLSLLLSGLALTLFNGYLFLDHRVYAVCRFHLDPFWVDYALHDFAGIGLPASSLTYAGLVMAGLAALEFGLLRLSRRIRPRRWILPALAAASLIAFVSSQLIHIVAFERDIGSITSLTPRLPFYMPVTSHGNAVNYGDLLPVDASLDGSRGGGEASSSLRYPLRDCPPALPEGTRPVNVVFLVLESWRFDAMSDSVTPHIDALSRKSSVFRRHFSSGNATTPGIFSLLYGLHPTYWMAVKSNNQALHNPLLIDLMQDAGYSFGIYADSNFERHKIKDTMFRDITVYETFTGSNRSEKEADMTRRMISFLRSEQARDHPFMLFAFYKASHYHYSYPDSFRRFTPVKEINPARELRRGEREAYLNDYRNAVRFDDALIGTLLDELESLGLMDQTAIVVTTDHGEEFDDDSAGYWGHASNFTQYQIRVPLVFYYPGRPARVVDTPTTHADIPTTLIQEVFAVRNDPSDYCNGRNLFRDLLGDLALVVASNVNHAYIIGDDVYAVSPIRAQSYRLDDINGRVREPRPDLLQAAMEGIGRFFPSGPAR